MSIFLPEWSGGSAPGLAQVAPTSPEVAADDVALMQRVLAAAAQSPNRIPDAFMAYVLDYIQTNNLLIPIGQVFGFAQYTAQTATTVLTEETTTSLSFVDLATIGPQLSGIPDGKYVVIFGCIAKNSTGTTSVMSFDVNGAGASENNRAVVQLTGFGSTMRAVPITLSNNGSNTLTSKYRVDGGTGTFRERWLFALKYANL